MKTALILVGSVGILAAGFVSATSTGGAIVLLAFGLVVMSTVSILFALTIN